MHRNDRRAAGWLMRTAGVLAVAASAGGALAQGAGKPAPIVVAETDIAREGEGARRDALNKRERKAFDSTLWAKLSDWTNGKALTATDTKDKVVLIATWTGYLPTSRRVPALATRLAEEQGKKGLIVVMVHGEQQWDKAAKPAAPEGTTLLLAHDAKGEFRQGLDVDADPDFYLIDRAGQLRFADVTLEALDTAVARLIAEDSGAAAGISDRLMTEQAERERAQRRATTANTQATFTNIPELPFNLPDASEYEKAKWPRRPLDRSKQQEERGAQLPAKDIRLPDEGWYPSKPKTEGRIVIVYDWHPRIAFTYNPMFEYADQLQIQYPRDVVVIGALSTFPNVSGRQMEKKDNDPAELAKDFERFTKSRVFRHALVNNSKSPIRSQADGDEEYIAPVLMMLSSDGKARWWIRAEDEGAPVAMESALLDLLKNDPGVQARRKVEAAWIARQQGKSEAEVQAAIEAAASAPAADKAPPPPPAP